MLPCRLDPEDAANLGASTPVHCAGRGNRDFDRAIADYNASGGKRTAGAPTMLLHTANRLQHRAKKKELRQGQ